MYTGSCDVTQLGACKLKIRREDFGKKERENVGNGDVDLELIGKLNIISKLFKLWHDCGTRIIQKLP